MPFLNIDLLLGKEVSATSLPLMILTTDFVLRYSSVRHCCSEELQQLLNTTEQSWLSEGDTPGCPRDTAQAKHN